MLIASTLNNNSNGYSIVNKEFLASYIADYSRDFTKCAVADIANVSAQSNYRVVHNLGTQNIVLNAYEISSTPVSVEVSYSVPDASTVVVSFDSLGEIKPTVRIVIIGALTNSTARVSLIKNSD